jgi:hypothetical protein
MRKIPVLAALLFLTAAPSKAQVVQIVAKNTRSVAVTPKVANDTFVVECDYGTTGVVPSIADTAGLTYTQAGGTNTSTNLEQFVFVSSPTTALTADTLTCPTGKNFGEIYVVELTGPLTVDGVSVVNGLTSPATGTLTPAAGDFVVAFCITGTCSDASEWGALTNYDDNLVAEFTSANGTTLTPSFATTSNWVLTMVSLKPAPPAPPATINLGVSGSITLVSGAPVINPGGALVANQWNGTTWTALGVVTLNSTGTLSGQLGINPAYVDSSGNISFQFCVPGVINCVTETFQLVEFQQGSTGLVINAVIFPAVLVPKSVSIALTP